MRRYGHGALEQQVRARFQPEVLRQTFVRQEEIRRRYLAGVQIEVTELTCRKDAPDFQTQRHRRLVPRHNRRFLSEVGGFANSNDHIVAFMELELLCEGFVDESGFASFPIAKLRNEPANGGHVVLVQPKSAQPGSDRRLDVARWHAAKTATQHHIAPPCQRPQCVGIHAKNDDVVGPGGIVLPDHHRGKQQGR